ncbi:hypothetical protein HYW83_06250 [Candidatus Peregrinibacteria bacterium]|nr:hypothetical protein [Candidatus Peregrinibacteria bacterium]
MAQIISLLAIGFFFGLRHAFDADHIAAVSIFSAQSLNKKASLLKGIFWGLGHTLVLFIVGIFVLFLGFKIPERMSAFFETGVSFLLIGLGGYSLYKTRGQTHSHPPLGMHTHNSSSFLVGIIHGLAGSAAIFVLIISTIRSAILGLLYILVFGLGTIAGMVFVSFFIGIATLRVKKYAGFAAGVFSLSLGIFLLFSSKFF